MSWKLKVLISLISNLKSSDVLDLAKKRLEELIPINLMLQEMWRFMQNWFLKDVVKIVRNTK